MKDLLVHLVVSALLLALVDYFIDGITIAGFGNALIAAIALGIVNALIRPILVVLTLPITVLTLGLFLLVINALMILLAAAVVPGLCETHGLDIADVNRALLRVLSHLQPQPARSRGNG